VEEMAFMLGLEKVGRIYADIPSERGEEKNQLFFCCCYTGAWTQVLRLGRQLLYHLNHAP
jgi:hypothetical protein